MRGRHFQRGDVRYGRAKRVTIESRSPSPVEIDGDAAGFTPIDITIEPGALRILAPKGD
jgi:diacylglycerol kinase family enzyme